MLNIVYKHQYFLLSYSYWKAMIIKEFFIDLFYIPPYLCNKNWTAPSFFNDIAYEKPKNYKGTKCIFNELIITNK